MSTSLRWISTTLAIFTVFTFFIWSFYTDRSLDTVPLIKIISNYSNLWSRDNFIHIVGQPLRQLINTSRDTSASDQNKTTDGATGYRKVENREGPSRIQNSTDAGTSTDYKLIDVSVNQSRINHTETSSVANRPTENETGTPDKSGNDNRIDTLSYTTSATNVSDPASLLDTNASVPRRNETTKYLLTVQLRGRLGNQMLQYAALYATARRHRQWTPVLMKPRRHDMIRPTFGKSLSIPTASFKLEPTAVIEEDVDADVTLRRLRQLPENNVTLSGFFQSHKFFDDVKYDLRKEFAFPSQLEQKVFAYFRQITPAQWRNLSFVRVGVHVRRRSLIKEKRQRMGFLPRPPTYFADAMNYFKTKYDRVQFIVASDDLPWCEENIHGDEVVFSNGDAIMDFAILSLSDHVITCLGTYSWWAGWLCKGTTIYYGVPPPQGTYLSVIYANNKWVPPPDDEYNHWLPIT